MIPLPATWEYLLLSAIDGDPVKFFNSLSDITNEDWDNMETGHYLLYKLFPDKIESNGGVS